MSIEFKIDPKQKLIIGKASGQLNHKDILDIMDAMVKHPDYEPNYNEIWDLREVIDLKTFFGETRQRVENEKALRKLKNPNRDALVVANPIHYGIARQYAFLAESIPLDVEIFYDFKEAMKWVCED
jgi:hypothetical protein